MDKVVRPQEGAEQHSINPKTDRPASFNDLHGPEAARVADKTEKPVSRRDLVCGLDSAHGAFHSASAEAKAAFLACYEDADPHTKATLALMTGKDQPSSLLA